MPLTARPLPPDLPAPLAPQSQPLPPLPEPQPDHSPLHNPQSRPSESEKSEPAKFRSIQPPASHSETATRPPAPAPYQLDILSRPRPPLPQQSAANPAASKSANRFQIGRAH